MTKARPRNSYRAVRRNAYRAPFRGIPGRLGQWRLGPYFRTREGPIVHTSYMETVR